MGGDGWDSGDVWGLNGIHLRDRNVATLAQKDNEMECHAGAQANLPAGQSIGARSLHRIASARSRRGKATRKTLEPSDSKMHQPVPFDA